MSVTPPAPREFQRKFDASWRELYPEQAHQVRWAVTAQSELLLSPLLAAPKASFNKLHDYIECRLLLRLTA